MRSALVIVGLGLAAGPNGTAGMIRQDTVAIGLEELVGAAVLREFNLQIDRYGVARAGADVTLARAVFDPAFEIIGDLSRSDQTAVTATGDLTQSVRGRTIRSQVVGALPTSTQYSVGVSSVYRFESPVLVQQNLREYDNLLSVTIEQPLLDGFGAMFGLATVRAAERGRQSVESGWHRRIEETVGTVELLYWDVAQRDAELAVAGQSLERAQVLLRRNEELRALERISEVDLITARLGVAARERALIRARQLRDDAIDRLVYFAYGATVGAVGVTAADDVRLLDGPDLTAAMPELPEAQALALRRRADVTAARLELESQQTLRRVERNALLPSVNLVASYTTLLNNAGAIGLTASRVGDLQSRGWNLGLRAALPLTNSAARANVAAIEALIAQTELLLQQTESRVAQEVREAHRAIRLGRETLDAAIRAVALAERQYEMEGQRLELGLSESFRLLQQEEQIAGAQFDEIAARYDLARGVTAYHLAVGQELLQKYGLRIPSPDQP